MMNLEESIKIAVEGCGVSLYDIGQFRENDMNIFRVYITSPDGVNLDKCSEVSRMISPILDIDEPMSGKYNLEVSSPGIERKLKKIEHFIASIGENVRVKEITTDKIEGKLKAANDENITIETEDGDVTIAHDEILAASTYIIW
jgi:ribosome maturation factor RimP